MLFRSDIVEMSPFIVTAKTRGILPIAAVVRRQFLGGSITSPAYILEPDHPAHLAILEKHGLSPKDRIISIDGEKIQGMAGLSRLNEIWFEGDPGRQLTLVIQGSGENESIFRKIVVTTISLARLRKIEEEWCQQHPDKEQPAQEQPGKEKKRSSDSEDWKWRKL